MSEQLTLFAEGSLARMSARPVSEQESTAPARDYGSSTPDSLASYDPDTSSWRTSQGCFLEEWETFSESWPRSGMMRNGIAYQLPPLVPLTDVTASGLLATPTSTANQMAPSMMKHRSCAALFPTPSHTSYGSNQGGAAGRTGPVRHSLESMARTGMWPTPAARDGGRGAGRSRAERTGETNGEPLTQVIGGSLNPTWVEWLMGFPLGHTDLEP